MAYSLNDCVSTSTVIIYSRVIYIENRDIKLLGRYLTLVIELGWVVDIKKSEHLNLHVSAGIITTLCCNLFFVIC